VAGEELLNVVALDRGVDDQGVALLPVRRRRDAVLVADLQAVDDWSMWQEWSASRASSGRSAVEATHPGGSHRTAGRSKPGTR
jgi:hypothetical protein